MAFARRFLQHRGITVIQKLDPSLPRLRRGKIGIVLAGGAVSGGAFKAGGLRALNDAFVQRRLSATDPGRPFGLSDFDVFVGLSGPNTIDPAWLAKMARGAMVFAMANPTPEVAPELVPKNVSVIATGRSDYPNQINNVLCFPGIFKGALSVHAR